MRRLAACGLAALHFLHRLWTILLALLYYPFLANPQTLQHRTKLPKNLALVFTSSQEKPSEEERDAIVQSVVLAVRWCKIAGVNSLCVYDRHGLVIKLSGRIKAALQYDAGHVQPDSEYSSDGSDTENPPSPQLTDFMDSRPISPETWCSPPSMVTINLDSDPPHAQSTSYQRKQVANLQPRKPHKKSSQLTLSLVSYEASKPLLASVARSFAASCRTIDGAHIKDNDGLGISVESVDRLVHEYLHLPPPDLMIVHPVKQYALTCPLELHGFPPSLVRLTEIYYDERPSLSRAWHNRGAKRNFASLSEETFRRALDSYARAEMRLGK